MGRVEVAREESLNGTAYVRPDDDLLWLRHNLKVSLRLSRLALRLHAAGCTLGRVTWVIVGAHKHKSPSQSDWGFCIYRVLTMTYFHAVYPALSSAQLRFTVLFGMGRRGSTVLCSSGIRLSGVDEPTPDVSGRSSRFDDRAKRDDVDIRRRNLEPSSRL